jgi:hypothetical protein
VPMITGLKPRQLTPEILNLGLLLNLAHRFVLLWS